MKRVIVLLAAIAMLGVMTGPALGQVSATPATAQSVDGPTCSRPESDAEALYVLGNYYANGGYVWDDAHLTVAVQSQPGADEAMVEAIHDAIAAWNAVLVECFDGAITLTDVTGTKNARQADITIRYVLHAHGVARGAFALCVNRQCPNVLISSIAPPGSGYNDSSVQGMEWMAMHELGHALGLGHSTNIDSIDLMGYGWMGRGLPAPILSSCDVDALAFIWSWALQGTEPAPPGPGPYDCSQG